VGARSCGDRFAVATDFESRAGCARIHRVGNVLNLVSVAERLADGLELGDTAHEEPPAKLRE
jgi:hypothetical protein